MDYTDLRRQTAPDERPGWDDPSLRGMPAWDDAPRSDAPGWDDPAPDSEPEWDAPRSRARGWDAPSRSGAPGWDAPSPPEVPAWRPAPHAAPPADDGYEWGRGRTGETRTVAPEAYFDDDPTWRTRPEVDPGWDIAPADDPRWDDAPAADPRGHRRQAADDWQGEPAGEQAEPRHAAVDSNLEAAWQNYLSEQDIPDAPDEGGRRLVWMLIAATLMTSVALWWFSTPHGSIHSTGDALTAAGRITGMVAGYLLLLQVLLMSRVTWLERWIGAHYLMSWHRDLGGALLLLVLGHISFIILGYAGQFHTGVEQQAFTVITTYPSMISATIATGILVATGFLAIRAVRRLLPYEVWYYMHVCTYLILILGYGHQFANGEELHAGVGFGRWYWIALYLFVIGCLLWGRVITPLRLNRKHQLRFAEAVDEGAGMVSLYIAGKRLTELPVQAGQFFRWRFLARGQWWQAHPFSLSEAPNGKWLRLTIKMVGDHTRALPYLRPGVRVFAEGPSGVFTADRRVAPRALLIAAGSGIAPIRALLEDLPHGTIVLYRATSEQDIVFREELDELAARGGDRVLYVLGRRGDRWPAYVFSPKGMREIVPDVRRRDVYLCGPPGMVQGALHTLRRLRVPREQIHLDPFEF